MFSGIKRTDSILIEGDESQIYTRDCFSETKADIFLSFFCLFAYQQREGKQML